MPAYRDIKLTISHEMLLFREIPMNDWFHFDGIYWQKHDTAAGRAHAHFLNDAGMPFKSFSADQLVRKVNMTVEVKECK